MTTIVGIFDNAESVDKVVEQLAAVGVESVVYDEAIVAEEPSSGDPAVPTRPAGSAPAVVSDSEEPNLLPRRDKNSIVRAFKAHLADYHLTDDVIEAYATTFAHSGKFVLVKTDKESAERIMEIMRNSGATGVNKHT